MTQYRGSSTTFFIFPDELCLEASGSPSRIHAYNLAAIISTIGKGHQLNDIEIDIRKQGLAVTINIALCKLDSPSMIENTKRAFSYI